MDLLMYRKETKKADTAAVFFFFFAPAASVQSLRLGSPLPWIWSAICPRGQVCSSVVKSVFYIYILNLIITQSFNHSSSLN